VGKNCPELRDYRFHLRLDHLLGYSRGFRWCDLQYQFLGEQASMAEVYQQPPVVLVGSHHWFTTRCSPGRFDGLAADYSPT
jgi:hypothetical protein